MKSDLRASESMRASFNAQRNVGFSNFVPRAREMHNRTRLVLLFRIHRDLAILCDGHKIGNALKGS